MSLFKNLFWVYLLVDVKTMLVTSMVCFYMTLITSFDILLLHIKDSILKLFHFSGEGCGGVNEDAGSRDDRRPRWHGCDVHHHMRRSATLQQVTIILV